MEHAAYVYTGGLSQEAVEERLRSGDHGVLGLADGDDAYAVPLSYHYDGDAFLLRVSDHDGHSEKRGFIEATETATFVCYGATDSESWSVQIRGPLREWQGDADEERINEWFPAFRLFDEAIENVGFTLYELQMEAVVGRETIE